MKQVDQTFLKPPNGNCLAACVASILDLTLDDIPNFVALDDWKMVDGEWVCSTGGQRWWYSLAAELANHGLRPIEACHPGGGHWSTKLKEGDLAIATIQSPRGNWLHCVVAEPALGEVTWDPYPEGYEPGFRLTDEMVETWLFIVKILAK